MSVLTLRTDKEFLKKLDILSRVRGKTRSALVKEILEKALEQEGMFVEQATLAMKKGKKPDVSINWEAIDKELERSSLFFESVEEAMGYSRKRIWRKR